MATWATWVIGALPSGGEVRPSVERSVDVAKLVRRLQQEWVEHLLFMLFFFA